MNKTILIIIAILIIIIIGGYFLLGGNYKTPVSPLPLTSSPEAGVSNPEAPINIREFIVSGTEFKFDPADINIRSGEKIKITFKNNGRSPHNLTIEELGIGTRTIGGGQTNAIEFVAPDSGTYTFFCSVSGHRSAGMEGNLKVE